MSTRVNRAELLQTLAWVEPGLSTADFIAQSQSFVFQRGWVVTFNDEICCRVRSPLPPEFAGAVRAKHLKAALENMPGDDVDLQMGEGVIQIRTPTNRMWSKIRMESQVILPVDQVEAPAGGDWISIPEGFSDAVETVVQTAGRNTKEFLTTCVHVHPDYLESCDRFQASRYDIPMGTSRPFLVRANSLVHVPKFGPTKMAETPNWVHFRNKNKTDKTTVLSVRRQLDEYPEIGKMLYFKGNPTILPKGAAEASKLAGEFAADGESDKVLVTLTDGKMTVEGSGTFGEAGADLDTSYKGEKISFRIAPLLLAAIVAKHNSCEVSQGRLRVVGEKWVYMALLGVPDEAPAPVTAPPEPAGEEELAGVTEGGGENYGGTYDG